jgi:magnesium transporter
MSEASIVESRPWEDLEEIIRSGNDEALALFLQLLPPEETVYTVSQLEADDRTKMLEALARVNPEFAADMMEHFADAHAADMIEEMEPEAAAAIVEEMDSDEQADVLAELSAEDAEAILQEMDPEEAEGARQRLQYPGDTAGGLMITEILAYRRDQTIDDVLADLRDHTEQYDDYENRYIYVTDDAERVRGVLSMRKVPMLPRDRPLWKLAPQEPVTVPVTEPLDELEDLFDRVDFNAVPVVDEDAKLIGAVQRAAVQEALSERNTQAFLKFGGIIGGEELRSMDLRSRWLRRLAFLAPNLLLSAVSVSIIGFFQDVIERITALAIFLPLIANVSGAAGNQSVAVSIRELTLGVVLPRDVMRVVRKEVLVGLFNGLVIGGVIAIIVIVSQAMFRMEGPPMMLACLVGGVFAMNSVFAVCVGGALPLALKRLDVDPAMVSSPVLTTLTDMGAFFLTLSFATALLAAVD